MFWIFLFELFFCFCGDGGPVIRTTLHKSADGVTQVVNNLSEVAVLILPHSSEQFR